MQTYVAQPCSRRDLRRLAMGIRLKLGLEDSLYFPVVQLLELMSAIFPRFHFEIVEDGELPPGVHADTDVENHIVRIMQSVYDGACAGSGRDRMTIAHEIGHYLLLCVWGFRFQRNFAGNAVPTCQDPEWQAKCFAGELLVAAHLTGHMSPKAIAVVCGVSLLAAQTQWRKLRAK